MHQFINRIRLIKGIINGSDAFTGPLVCNVDLTDKCFANCIGCWTHSPHLKNTSSQSELKLEIVKASLLDFKSIGVKKVCFSGRGEPFLHSNFLDILSECNRLHLKVSINSTGDYLNEDIIKDLSNYNIEILKISLWSLDKINMRVLCPGRHIDDVYNMLEQVKMIIKYNRKIVQFNCIITKNNIWEIVNFINKAHESGVTYIKFEPIQPFNGNKFMVLGTREKEYIISMFSEYKKLLWKYRIKSNINGFIEKLLLDKDDKGNYNPHDNNNIPCFHGWTGVRILANGDVVFCCECVEQPIGNIVKKRFKDIWFSEEYSTLRQKAMKYGCINWKKGEINCEYVQKNKIISRLLYIPKILGYFKNNEIYRYLSI